LVTFGPDVKMFSDLAGIHYVRMDSPEGKEILRKKLEAVVGPIDRTGKLERPISIRRVPGMVVDTVVTL
jgi:hypothetical protein